MTVGELDASTRKAGIIVLRVAAIGSAVAVVAAVRPLNVSIQKMWAALHNWAGPLADKLGHTRHAGKPIRVRDAGAGWMVSNQHVQLGAAIAGAVLVVWVVLAVNKVRRRDPLAVVEGRRNWAGISAAIVVVAALVVFGALQVEPGRAAVALLLRGLAGLGDWAQRFTAYLMTGKPGMLSRLVG
jgi:hypothetical protein